MKRLSDLPEDWGAIEGMRVLARLFELITVGDPMRTLVGAQANMLVIEKRLKKHGGIKVCLQEKIDFENTPRKEGEDIFSLMTVIDTDGKILLTLKAWVHYGGMGADAELAFSLPEGLIDTRGVQAEILPVFFALARNTPHPRLAKDPIAALSENSPRFVVVL